MNGKSKRVITATTAAFMLLTQSSPRVFADPSLGSGNYGSSAAQPIAPLLDPNANPSTSTSTASIIPSGSLDTASSPLSPPAEGKSQPDNFTDAEGQVWTYAKSNRKYAFAETYARVGSYTAKTLKLMNTETKSIQTLASVVAPSGAISSIRDVSPESTPGGPVVIYETHSLFPSGGTVTAQRVTAPADKLLMTGILQSMTFSQNTAGVSLLEPDLAPGIETNHDVNLSDLKLRETYYRMIPGSDLKIDSATKSLLFFSHRTTGAIKVYAFDASNPDRMMLTRTIDLGSDMTVETSLLKMVQDPEGALIASIGLKASYSHSTYLVNIKTGQTFRTSEGAATSIAVAGELATLNLVSKTGVLQTLEVNLQTMKETAVLTLDPKTGTVLRWQRAASHSNYAFRQALNGSQRTLLLLEISTGTVKTIAKTALPYSFSSIQDVSPDASYVIYGTNHAVTPNTGTVIIQSRINANQKIQLNGVLSGITFSQNGTLTQISARDQRHPEVITVSEINLPVFSVTNVFYKIPVNSDLTVDAATKLLLVSRRTSSGRYEVDVFDASAGSDHLALLKTAAMGSDLGGTFSKVEALQIPGLGRFVAIGLDADHFNKTKLINADTGAEYATSAGALTSLKIEGVYAIMTLLGKAKTTTTLALNLKTMTVVPLPVVYLDADHDGSLTKSEVAKGMRDLQTAVRTKDGQTVVPSSPDARFDIDRDGRITGEDLLRAVLMMAQQMHRAYMNEEERAGLAAFMTADINHDWAVSSLEKQNAQTLVQIYSRFHIYHPAYDVNEDGNVDLQDCGYFAALS